jgi:hypothetical protein
MKRRIVALALMTLLVLALTACGKEEETFTKTLTVLEIGSGSLLAVDTEDPTGEFFVPLEHFPASPEPQVGDIIEVTYDGGIAETYPAMFDHIFSISGIEADSNSEGWIVFLESEDDPVPLSAEEIETVRKMLETGTWEEETAECANDCRITIEGEAYDYHSECGTINDHTNGRHMTLNDEDREKLDRIIASDSE